MEVEPASFSRPEIQFDGVPAVNSVRSVDAMEVEPATFEAKRYLRSMLSDVYYDEDDTDQDKDDHIEGVLQDERINNWLCDKIPWLLQAGEDLSLLLKNCDGHWALLIAALVEIAERALQEVDTTFPVKNHRLALENALEKIANELPFLEVVIYDPKMSKDDREAAWRLSANLLITQPQLIDWLRKPKTMANKQLSEKQMNGFMDKLLSKIDRDKPLRKKVFDSVQSAVAGDEDDEKPVFRMAKLDTLVDSLFAQPTSSAAAPALSFTTDQNWNAAKFLKGLKINNPKLEENLRELEADTSMFELTPKAEWSTQLTNWGAQGAQNLKVTQALFKAGLIK